jgi:hypothetical protein
LESSGVCCPPAISFAGTANIPQSIVASAAASGERQVSVNHSQLAHIVLTASGYFWLLEHEQ